MADRLQEFNVQQVPEQVGPAQKSPEQVVYVGPRPFERHEQGLFFGRDQEVSELLSLVVSSRVVLCYAPSGAGKTSLINAGLQPRLEKEGFEVPPSTRVGGQIPKDIDQKTVSNLYIFNALLSLAGKGGVARELAERTLVEFLSTRPHLTDEEGFPAARVLIFDQFEELLTSYPESWQQREAFFHQVHEALQADPLLRVLFLIREDFLARIEPYMRLLKPFQQARFRLALLAKEGARAAITGPLRGTGRRFKEGVADGLIDELLKVRVETAQGEPVEVVGEYVEPVQLQVVCRNLWRNLPPDVVEITSRHVKTYGDVNHALQNFYESCLALAKEKLNANEQTLRQWFEGQLITPAGTRGIVFRDAARTAGLPNAVVDFLEDQHLIRGEWRAGSRWYELTHDRFIDPIQQANQLWRTQRQGRRNLWVMAAGGILLLGLVMFSFSAGNRGNINHQAVSTATAVAQQATSYVQAQEIQMIENQALANSGRWADQALLANDPDLSLLLAVEANLQADTQDARRSLHKILSRQGQFGKKFLSEFDPQILSPKLDKRLEGHTNWVYSVAFSPDGTQIISGSKDLTIRVWDAATGELMGAPLTGHESEVWNVAYSPSGDLIASTDIGGKVLLWDASTQELIRPPLLNIDFWVTSMAFSPDGRRLAAGDGNGHIWIWDIPTIESVAPISLEAHKGTVWSLAWSPDGRLLASGSDDERICLWNTTSFSIEDTLDGPSGQVRSLAWSPDGRRLASGGVIETTRQSGGWTGGWAMLWDVATGQIIAPSLLDDSEPVRAVAFDPGGTMLAIGRQNGTITFWNARSEQIQGDALKAHEKMVMSLVFSPDGRYLLSGSIDQTVALWDLYAPARAVAFSPRDDALAVSEGAVISLWDPADKALPIAVLPGHTQDVLGLAFSPDGSTLASAGEDGEVGLWNVDTGKPIGALREDHGTVYSLAFNPEGNTLLSAAEDGTVLPWDVNTLLPGPPLYTHWGPIIKALFGVNRALYLGSRDGSLITVDLTNGESQLDAIPALQGQAVGNLAISRDGQRVAYSRETQMPAIDDGERAQGIELSEWSKGFDPEVNPSKIEFVVVLATNGINPEYGYEDFLRQIQPVPIRGASHLFKFDQPWQDQADAFLSIVQNQGFHFFTLMIDWGTIDESNSVEGIQHIEQWLRYVDERVDQKVLLEISTNSYDTWLRSYGDWSKWPLFIMQYPIEPDRDGSPVLPAGINDWRLWQYSTDNNLGREYGVGSDSVVLDVFNGTLTDMWKWLDIPVFTIFDRVSGQILNPSGLTQIASLNGIAFSPDDVYVASGGEHRVTLWDARLGNEITTLSVNGTTVTSLSFSPDGRMLAIGTERGTVLLWDLGLLYPDSGQGPYMDIACARVTRDPPAFTEAELKQYFGNSTKRDTCKIP